MRVDGRVGVRQRNLNRKSEMPTVAPDIWCKSRVGKPRAYHAKKEVGLSVGIGTSEKNGYHYAVFNLTIGEGLGPELLKDWDARYAVVGFKDGDPIVAKWSSGGKPRRRKSGDFSLRLFVPSADAWHPNSGLAHQIVTGKPDP